MKNNYVTASMLYNYVKCPHRVSMDLFGDPARRDRISPFVQLLWDRGNAFEEEVIKKLQVPFLNLRIVPDREREHLTTKAMTAGEKLIYGGRIRTQDLFGEPDLLRKQDGGYTAGDIKSGAGLEGINEDTDGKPKRHYSVQLALYTDILRTMGVSGELEAFVWDINGQEVPYNLNVSRGPRTPDSMWQEYQSSLKHVQSIASREIKTLPALASDCKLCHWRRICIKQLEDLNDLTLIPELGRSKRDKLIDHIANVQSLADIDISSLIQGTKTVVPGIGAGTLKKFQVRAQLQTEIDAKPYLLEQVAFPSQNLELFFDVETDPMRNICYLHGFVERRDGDISTEKFIPFFAQQPTQEAEEDAFAKAWQYIRESDMTAIYFYSKYERTIWRGLSKSYPNVATETDIEELFASKVAIDLYYDVVKSKMEWPTRDFSIKTLATFLGFKWRDKEPSGAASIEWYHQWVETEDLQIKQRILDYNEDDCLAMRILVDAIRNMPPPS